MKRASSLNEAALVLRSLPEKQAARILARLEPEDIKAVIGALTRLDRNNANQVSTAVERLQHESQRWRVDKILDVTLEETEEQVQNAVVTPKSLTEKSCESANPFDFLIETHPTIRTRVLSDEHPKNVAAVLSLFPPELASETMESLDPELRISVCRRLCEIEEIKDEEITGLAFALKLRVKKLLTTWYSDSVGVNVAAAMLSCANEKTRETMLELMSQSDPDLAQLLDQNVFRIQTLMSLTDDEIKVVLRSVDTACWAPALKNADRELKAKVLDNLGPRPAELLRYELDNIGFVESIVQDRARQSIVTEVMRLGREGKIDIRKSSDGQRRAVGLPVNLRTHTSFATESIN